jgi:D-glycero-alpha-D-manno-heptose-7-phosphate kinase
MERSAHAPLRIDLAGGTLDIWPLHLVLPEPAVTVNAALDLLAGTKVETLAESEPGIRLASQDQGKWVKYDDLDALRLAQRRGACPLPLLAEAVLTLEPPGALTLTTESAGPAGGGLGGSSALLCTVLAALQAALGRETDRDRLQRLAQDVETRVLGKPTGYQDYFPPLHGGCLALEGSPGGVRAERMDVDLEALARRLRLVYTGAPHASGITNWGVVRAYLDEEPATVGALGRIAVIARGVREALRAGDLDTALAGVIADGAERRRMAPGVSTKAIEAFDLAMRGAGALGTKVLGAGGGGCVLVVLPDDATAAARVDEALESDRSKVLPLRLEARGLRMDEA